MNTNSYTTPGENDNDKVSGEGLKDALLHSVELKQPDDTAPVGPFEHSGEVAGWTATEENQEKSRGDGPSQTVGEANDKE